MQKKPKKWSTDKQRILISSEPKDEKTINWLKLILDYLNNHRNLSLSLFFLIVDLDVKTQRQRRFEVRWEICGKVSQQKGWYI